MCGIYGVIDKTAVSREAFIGLGLANQQRGNRTFGYMTAVLSQPVEPPDVRRFMAPFAPQMAQVGHSQVVLAHNGTPTNGRPLTETAVHPFASRSALLAHNGLLLNDRQFPQWRLNPERPITVDSEIILGGIQHYLDVGTAVAEAIARTAGRLEGQQACWLWHLPTQQLYLWRVMSPLFILNDRQSFHFSSVRFGPIQQLLAEGIVYQLDPVTLALTEAATFDFYSPYKSDA
jgi:glutamine phosphoribosylpyrophosphate amidotransferase